MTPASPANPDNSGANRRRLLREKLTPEVLVGWHFAFGNHRPGLPEDFMSTTILDRPQADEFIAPAIVSERKRGPILIATDASESSDAAVRAARTIAAQTDQELLVVAVFKPIPLVAPEVQLATTPQLEEQGRAELRRQVAAQLDRMASGFSWPVQVVTGDPAASIATVAKAIGASVVIMGLGGHRMFERIFGDEMVLKVLRLGTVPVLAVAGGFSGPPKRVLAAVDFSSSCLRALTLGKELVRPGAKVTLAHVISPDLDPVN